ncbi:MAG: hypothetical protein QOH70_1288 [Blastocatellia bacterium]|jgi:hypothetical protein|nr:hypothetical protein [Blastocatellia bacterium]
MVHATHPVHAVSDLLMTVGRLGTIRRRNSPWIASLTPMPLPALCDKVNPQYLTIRADEVFLF